MSDDKPFISILRADFGTGMRELLRGGYIDDAICARLVVFAGAKRVEIVTPSGAKLHTVIAIEGSRQIAVSNAQGGPWFVDRDRVS